MKTQPIYVTSKTIEKMHKAQVQMMLDYFKVPLKKQSTKIWDLRDQLAEFWAKDSVEFDAAYRSVILHETGGEVVEQLINIDKIPGIIQEQVNNIKNNALSALRSTCEKQIEKRESEMAEYQKNFVAKVSDQFKKAVDRESEKYNTLAIKFDRKPAQKITGVVHHLFPRICQLGAARKNILMVGPSGCGKTHLGAQLASALGLRYASQSCSAGVSESAFSGWLLPIGKDGRFDYVMSSFVDMYENGGVFNFDEIDNSDANVLVFINQALANGYFFLPQRYKNRKVVKHADFVAIACANTFGGGADSMYHARVALDAATLDRFRLGTVFMDYSSEIEEKLINPIVLVWGLEIREKVAQHKLKKLLSTRTMLDATDMQRDCDWTSTDWDMGYFADWSKEEKAVCGFQGRGE